MTANDVISVGEPMPRIAAVSAHENWRITVTWEGASRPVIVNLAPAIFTYKAYRPLRDGRALFRSVRRVGEGFAIGWGEDDSLDMAATTVERLAHEMMEPADFAAFLERHDLTLDGAAAQLGISRRLVAYYAKERDIPRSIALACAYLDAQGRKRPAFAGI